VGILLFQHAPLEMLLAIDALSFLGALCLLYHLQCYNLPPFCRAQTAIKTAWNSVQSLP
jgi:hypothetical protein